MQQVQAEIYSSVRGLGSSLRIRLSTAIYTRRPRLRRVSQSKNDALSELWGPAIVNALIAVAEKMAKQVAVLVELQRFDEHNNILWARKLEKVGVCRQLWVSESKDAH